VTVGIGLDHRHDAAWGGEMPPDDVEVMGQRGKIDRGGGGREARWGRWKVRENASRRG
jgi:hypothetical protein